MLETRVEPTVKVGVDEIVIDPTVVAVLLDAIEIERVCELVLEL